MIPINLDDRPGVSRTSLSRQAQRGNWELMSLDVHPPLEKVSGEDQVK
jgi:hypothetical protein